jgi:hypothetical protein
MTQNPICTNVYGTYRYIKCNWKKFDPVGKKPRIHSISKGKIMTPAGVPGEEGAAFAGIPKEEATSIPYSSIYLTLQGEDITPPLTPRPSKHLM